MPIYEYRCRACGSTTEELRPLGDADVPLRCACGAHDVVRLPSLVARSSAIAGSGSLVGSELPMAGGTPGGSPSPASGCCGGGCCG
jgi:putative FmdB family regulatory protein